MFSFDQFDHLHSLWDGRSENTEVCISCKGICCPSVKALFPGEEEYLAHKTGQINASWHSNGCMCYQAGNSVKALICKIYPIRVMSDIETYVLESSLNSAYTTRCSDLKFDHDRVRPFFDFLFSDVDNRMFWALNFNLDGLAETIRNRFKEHDLKISEREAEMRAVYVLTHQSYDEHDILLKDILRLQKK